LAFHEFHEPIKLGLVEERGIVTEIGDAVELAVAGAAGPPWLVATQADRHSVRRNVGGEECDVKAQKPAL
jgi:hypothetical protein